MRTPIQAHPDLCIDNSLVVATHDNILFPIRTRTSLQPQKIFVEIVILGLRRLSFQVALVACGERGFREASLTIQRMRQDSVPSSSPKVSITRA